MAIIQSTGFYKGMLEGFETWEYATNSFNYVKIYQNVGNMPADADDWSLAAHVADELATFNDFDITSTQQSFLSGTTDDPRWGKIGFTTGQEPQAVNASATGTAAWFAMYDHASSPTDWLIGTVSLPGGGAVIRLSTLSLVSGNPVAISNFVIHFHS